MKTPAAILISGNGSNLVGLIESTSQLEWRVVLTTDINASGVGRARRLGLRVVEIPSSLKKIARDQFIESVLADFGVQIVALAGYMKILTGEFVSRWRGRIFNVHPSLLPKYPGLDSFARALKAGDKQAGPTVHQVDEGVDTGEILYQRTFDISQNTGDEQKFLLLHVNEIFSFGQTLEDAICRRQTT